MASNNDWSLEDLTPILQKMADGFFGSRPKINRERAYILREDEEFLSHLEKIRMELRIPELSAGEDTWSAALEHEEADSIEQLSFYLSNEISSNKLQRFRRAIKGVLAQYSLPPNFYEWVASVVLYREFPKGIPRYDWGLLELILNNPEGVRRVRKMGLSTTEKKFWLRTYRLYNGIGPGRIPKQYAEEYRLLLYALGGPKGAIRRSRTYDETLMVRDVRRGQNVELNASSEPVAIKKTYRDAVAEMTKIDAEKETTREAARYRQRERRARQRADSFKREKGKK